MPLRRTTPLVQLLFHIDTSWPLSQSSIGQHTFQCSPRCVHRTIKVDSILYQKYAFWRYSPFRHEVHCYILAGIINWEFQLKYEDIVISNDFNLNKHFFFLSFLFLHPSFIQCTTSFSHPPSAATCDPRYLKQPLPVTVRHLESCIRLPFLYLEHLKILHLPTFTLNFLLSHTVPNSLTSPHNFYSELATSAVSSANNS